MNKRLAGWAYSVLTVTGVVLVAAFFMSWLEFGDSTSGLSIARHEHWLFLVPISGALLAGAAGSKSEWTRLAAVAAGALIAGDMAVELLRGVLHFNLDMYLMFGGAVLAIVGSADKHRALRGAGGLAILVGFFAPWTSDSLFHGLRQAGDIADMFGFSTAALWLIPLAGIAACASANMIGIRGRRVALFSGVAVFASILWFIGSVANMVFAWGAWATFGASATALVIGLLAPTEKASRALAKPSL
ncbi:MAG: hypothetical protein ABI591_21540 [Kofleriaceae bacterium]